ncbi:MAG: PIN domain-containing protein [Acidobacteria bacterium]|nr:PIN domain-containing protein [Acidobacteriota bacterium]
MSPSPATKHRSPRSAFWDTSAVVPLCCHQTQTGPAVRLARQHPRQVAWWTTAVEATSAFNRLHRERALTAAGITQALARLDYLRRRWHEVLPTDDVRGRAERLPGTHALRAADALQLAAALVWCSDRPRGRHLVASDGRLADAARAEGFTLVRIG